MLAKHVSRFLGLPEVQIVDGRKGLQSFLYEGFKRRAGCEVCPRCAHPSSSVYDHRYVTLKDEPMRRSVITLRIKKRRYYCKHCRKPFTEPIQGVMPRRRTTQRYREGLMLACTKYSSLKDVREDFRCSSSLLYKVLYEQLERKIKQINYPWPKMIGIDEHFVSRKYGYPEFMTVFTDLKNHRVRECVLGKTKAGLLEKVAHIEGRRNVEWVTIDMSDVYRGFALEQFPKAQIVADKFHVLRLFTSILNRHRIDITGDKRRNPVRKLLLRNRSNLKYFERNALDDWLKLHPNIKEAYEWKEHFHRLYRLKGHARAEARFEKLLIAMKFSAIPEIKRLQRTLERWKDEILNYFKCGLTNAMTEGFNRVASLVKNRAFGYRNQNNYRLRFLSACAF